VITKSDAMCKIFPMIFYGSARVLYHNLKPLSILGLYDLCVKLLFHFSTIILVKKSITELFAITQWDDENTREYLHIFNEKILRTKDLLESITIKALINRVRNYFLWERLYIPPNKNLLSVKYLMKNYIRVEEASITIQGHPRFHTQEESPLRH